MNKLLYCPFYIRILYLAIFLFLSLLIGHWLTTRIFSAKEGATTKTPYSTNPKYKYIPSISPNSKTEIPTIEFGLGDLDAELEHACEFLKIDSSLSYVDPSGAPSPFAQSSGYSVAKSELKIHSLYSNAIQSGKPDGISLSMDASYGELFNSNVIQDWSNEKIKTAWNNMHSVKMDNALYSATKYFVIHSHTSKEPCVSMSADASGITLGGYFLKEIIANKYDSTALNKLKHTYYAIIKPRYLANTVSNVYWQNWQTLMNADGKSRDSIVYVISTMNELVANATLPADLSGTNVRPIISDTKLITPFTIDALRLYQTSSVVYELYRYMMQFSTTLKDQTNPIQTTPGTFFVGFQTYLDKLNNVSVPSTLAFVIKNPPDTNNCSTTVLSEGAATTEY